MTAAPDRVSLASALNLAAVAILLWIAIGITCEITTRIEDYGRVAGYQKGLLACVTNPGQDKSCPGTPEQLKGDIDNATTQVRNFNALNSVGAPHRCNIAAVFASPIGGFREDCLRVMSASSDPLQNKEYRRVFEEIMSPGWLSFSGPVFALDQRAKEPLYFCLVLVAAAIGSLIAGLRTAGITTLRDLTLGLGAGFAVYILMRGGNFVFLTGAGTAPIDVLNPFTAGAVGFLVGLFNDRVFGLLDGVVRKPGQQQGQPAPAQPAPAPAAPPVQAQAAVERIAQVAEAGAKAEANKP